MTADQLHLRPKHRRILETLLREHLPDVEVWAYGSRVNGRGHDGSDLDLVLRGPKLQEIPVGQLSDFEEAIRESTIPFLVEARDWARLPERFHREIEREYVVLIAHEHNSQQTAWKPTTIGHFCAFKYGKSLPENKRDGGQFGVYGSNGMVGQHSESLVDSGIIIGRKGSVGAVHYSSKPFWPIDTTFFVERDADRDTRFTYYLLRSLELFNMNSDSAVPGLNRGEAHALRVNIPPLPKQRAIAHILGTLDDKIELNRRMNETLEAMAQAIFKDWFVDFGPTRARMEGHEPYLPPEIWNQFPDTLDEEGKPIGWKISRLADIATSPKRSVKPANVAEDMPYIGLEHMPRRSIALTEWEGAGKVKSNKSVFKRGELLFGKLRPYFHKVGLAPVDGICSTDIVIVIPKMSSWAGFTLSCLSSNKFVDYTDQTSTGTKMPRTGWKTMGQYEICLPSEQILRAFQSIWQILIDRLSANIHENRSLAQTRDTLLPKLISEELRVKDVELSTLKAI